METLRLLYIQCYHFSSGKHIFKKSNLLLIKFKIDGILHVWCFTKSFKTV